jgi:Protein of unknown function (DUF4031)
MDNPDNQAAQVYTDGVHLVCGDTTALHAFASTIGLKRDWFQGKALPHYDLTSRTMVNRAIRNGAKVIPSKMVVVVAREAKRLDDEDAFLSAVNIEISRA